MPVRKGVRKGHVTSPLLLTACLQRAFEWLDCKEMGIRVKGDFSVRVTGDCISKCLKDVAQPEMRLIGISYGKKKGSVG